MSSESLAAKKPRARGPGEAPTPRGPAPRSPLLRFLDCAGVGLFLALTFLLGAFPLKDTDFWWHLKTGDMIRRSGRVPTFDIFTFTVPPETPWIDLHWIFQVALSWGYAHGGVVALNLAKCAITTVAVLVLVTARRRGWPVWAMLIAWIPSLLVLGGRMYVRPETLSLLYLSIYLAVLFRIDRRPALAFALPLVQVVWVNTQGLFVLGPIVLSFALIDAALRPGSFSKARRPWWRKVGLATVLTGVACLINPYGLIGALYPLELARTMSNPIFSTTIGELTPIPLFIQRSGLSNLSLQLQLMTMILGALSFLVPLCWTVWVRLTPSSPAQGGEERPKAPSPAKVGGKELKVATSAKAGKVRKQARTTSQAKGEDLWGLSPFRLLLFVAFSALSLQATRNSHQFAAVVGTVTAWNLGEWAAAIHKRRAPRFEVAPRLVAMALIVLVFAGVASGTFYVMTGEGREVGLGEQRLWYPHEAVEFAGTPGMPTRYLGYHIGHASLYEYRHGPERKVFADARLEVIGADLYERYETLKGRIAQDVPGWERDLDDMKRPLVLLDHENFQVGATLLIDPRWRCVWFDPVAAVFVHEAYAGVTQSYTVDFAARHFRSGREDDPKGAAARFASAMALRNYSGDIGQARGRVDLSRPMVLLGLDHARHGLEVDPASPVGWKVLGQLELSRDGRQGVSSPRYRLPFDPVFDLSSARGTYALRRALEASPDDFTALLSLVRVYELRAMHEAALPLLDRLALLRPINPMQMMFHAEVEPHRAQLRASLGPELTTSWENQSELDQAVTARLAVGRAGSAATLLERAYPIETRPWEVSDRLGTLWLHLGEPTRARAAWEGALAAPSPALRRARVALTHLVEGSFGAARQAFREAMSGDPTLFEAAYGLAVLETDAGRAAEALAAARTALALAPNDIARSASKTLVDLASPYAGPTPTTEMREGGSPGRPSNINRPSE